MLSFYYPVLVDVIRWVIVIVVADLLL
jgi:hypothetical protein